jgi:TPR repeat protein
MKRRWVIVAITSMALIGAGVLIRTERNNRRLSKLAETYDTRARRGDAKAQLTLGWMYYYGKGLPKDYVEAALWYRKSAEQGTQKPSTLLLTCITRERACLRMIRKPHAGAKELPNRGTLSLRISSASSMAEAKECHRTMQRLSAGIANPPNKIIRRLNMKAPKARTWVE